MKVNNYIVKIIGLLGDYPTKERLQFQNKLIANGYHEDEASPELKSTLKDIFYREFREIMFVKRDDKKASELLSRRFSANHDDAIRFNKLNRGKEITNTYEAFVKKSEVYFFGEEIALFSLTIEVAPENQHIEYFSDLINQIRNFDAESVYKMNNLEQKSKWHEFISRKYLSDTKLRDENENIKADEYSGSKFKIFSVFDTPVGSVDREPTLYDLGTSSPLGSGSGAGDYAPHPEYYQQIMSNKISYFNNWQSLCLFDSFTTIGTDIISYENQKKTWQDTYFRIYLFRLFFKYNLFRYNTDLNENTVKLRNRFESFLNNYKLNQISFNFLPNEIYSKIGLALRLDEELDTFQQRINRISDAIQEEKQSRMNMLLQAVTALSALGSVQPLLSGLSFAQQYLGWSNALFYAILTLMLLLLAFGVCYFLFPDQIKKLIGKIKKKK